MLGVSAYKFILENDEDIDIPNSLYGGLLQVVEYSTGACYLYAIKAGTFVDAVLEITNNGNSKINVTRYGNHTTNPYRQIRVTNVSLGRTEFFIRYIRPNL